MLPKVSVIIPNYNHSHYLPQRIESVLSQTCRNIEVIILDDCSSDDSRDIIARYAAQDSRIRVILNEQNSGSTFKQWNKGIAICKSEYIWLAESDDYADEKLLEKLISSLEADKSIGLAYCDSWSVNEKNQIIGDWVEFYNELDPTLWVQSFVIEGCQLLKKFMSFRNIIPNASAVVMRRSIIEQVGPADETFRINGDWIFWGKILAISKISFVSERLNYFRQHTNNVRSNTISNGIATLESVRVVLILSSLVELESLFYDKIIDTLLDRWINGIIKDEIPFFRNVEIYKSFKSLNNKNIVQFRKKFAKQLMINRFSGVKQILKNKFLKSIK